MNKTEFINAVAAKGEMDKKAAEKYAKKRAKQEANLRKYIDL